MTTALTLNAAAAEFTALEKEMNSAFCERRAEVRSLLTALVAGEHVLLLGPPGTAKSALTNALTKAINGGRQFTVLMTKYTVPEEVFGPISLTGLERDEYRRVTTGYFPEAKVAFLDEIFKANSSILNALLTALNERIFDNGGQRQSIPLELCVAASNELPQDESLAALYDRFVLRHWVAPIKARDALKRLLVSSSEPTVNATLSPEAIATLRAAAQAVTVTDEVAEAILDLRDQLAQKHGIQVSDRRWRKCIKLLRARAALAGRTMTVKNDLLVLSDVLWDKPEDRSSIAALVATMASPALGEATRLVDAAIELHGKLDTNSTGAARTASLGNANSELTKMYREGEKLVAVSGNDPEVVEMVGKVKALQQDVARKMAQALGLTNF
jgi:MoxR-like ATPase